MPDLKLGKLPDRTPVKITFIAPPDLNKALQAYAALYRETYGEAESVPELIPYMLQSFLEADRGFAKARKALPEGEGKGTGIAQPGSRGRAPRAPLPPTDKED
ncbi:DUF2274 domain-containing protein [Parvibaculum sp.]|jgi:hypothetical protein|nr:DUF2274 domain-containing protein [Parvibaculum sp.]MAB14849.1 transposase [Parvibaculum sp.]MBA4211181.1 DUF2274 domain-containing protein [Parvibaculum sp.]MDX5416358.1 DUF2274 domain-containing protein [Alphaproteobacteria bacterium]MDX5493707.1 DUF2274 domain-containing protein [Alphaproteobacteria bacterium]